MTRTRSVAAVGAELRFVLFEGEALHAWLESSQAAYISERVAAGDSEEAARDGAARVMAGVAPEGRLSSEHLAGALMLGEERVGHLWVGPAGLGSTEWLVYDVEIVEARRGQGLGRAAMRLAEELALKRGATAMVLSVFANNEVAHGLYVSLGYRDIAIRMRKQLS